MASKKEQSPSNATVLPLNDLDRSSILLAGGKGANLGELIKIEGLKVPPGFCVTTNAYGLIANERNAFNILLTSLRLCSSSDMMRIKELSASIRQWIKSRPIDRQLSNEISLHLKKFGLNTAFAVRSSATAEDMPTASFAGQQDTYLNVIGVESILSSIKNCWASLFTDRAVIYRIQNGFEHHQVKLAVVVQQMIFPEAAGILFTADPLTGNRKIASIDAGFGLGEAMVSGLINADNYLIRGDEIIGKKIGSKQMAIYALKNGGTEAQPIAPDRQVKQALTDEQVIALGKKGREIERHFGQPQDIEWCLFDSQLFILQSRPITTLFPVPKTVEAGNRVYVSVGHQQMMTDAMKPLGISMWQSIAPRPMFEAGGRVFVDVTGELSTPKGRMNLLSVLGHSDPLIKDALKIIIERNNFLVDVEDKGEVINQVKISKGVLAKDIQSQVQNGPSLVIKLMKDREHAIAASKKVIHAQSGIAVLDAISKDILQLKTNINPQNLQVIMAGINASTWINDKMMEWLGEKNAADKLSQSVAGNVTSAMGLALLEVADAIRPFPDIVTFLQETKNDEFLNDLPNFKGGKEARTAIRVFLDQYGARCVGEIDITKPRWIEKPITLIPAILNNIKNFGPGAAQLKFNDGLNEALNSEQDLLHRLLQLPEGKLKAAETKEMVKFMRGIIGYREYPKYHMVNRLLIYKSALLKEAELLKNANILEHATDIFFLSLAEIREMMETRQQDPSLINRRKEDYESFQKLSPPRVMTSDGEIIKGRYNDDGAPEGSILGLAVSAGLVEGRARVILDIKDAYLDEGDILITTFTDPSWTPLFISIKGLVTEVGGLMTHGAVIAREYGLPAIVGVENATKLIKDGQQIRLNGTEGYIEILSH